MKLLQAHISRILSRLPQVTWPRQCVWACRTTRSHIHGTAMTIVAWWVLISQRWCWPQEHQWWLVFNIVGHDGLRWQVMATHTRHALGWKPGYGYELLWQESRHVFHAGQLWDRAQCDTHMRWYRGWQSDEAWITMHSSSVRCRCSTQRCQLLLFLLFEPVKGLLQRWVILWTADHIHAGYD